MDELLPFHRERGWRAYADFANSIRDRRFDVVLDCQRALKAGLLTRMLDAPVKLGWDRARSRDLNWWFCTDHLAPGPVRHMQNELYEFLDWLQVPVIHEWKIPLEEDQTAARNAFFGTIEEPVLAVVLRSSRADKDWTLDGYARVVEVARFELGLRPMLVGGGGAAEREDAARLRTMCRADTLDMLGGDLRRLTWLLDGSAAILSPDSGPLHMADALGTPAVGLFGTTDPKYYGPARSLDLVVDGYTRPGEDRPSRRRRPGRTREIRPEAVIAALERALERGSSPRSDPPGPAVSSTSEASQ